MKPIVLIAIVFAVVTATARAEEESSKAKGVVWDAWYTVTVKAPDKEIHYEYYNDQVVHEKKGQVRYQNQVWKNEEGSINEEHLGAVAEDTADLKPLFFNFRAKYRNQELSIDGNVENGRELKITVNNGKDAAKVVQKKLESKVFWSSLFPVWLKHHLPKMKEGKEVSFKTVQEDNLEKNFDSVSGAVRIEKLDEFAKKNHVLKLKVIYQNLPSTWYVEKDGRPVHVIIPEQGLIIDRVTKEEAEAFFKN
jgi:hypothetical protein